VQSLFPSFDILEDFKHPDLVYHTTSKPMELDLYLPDLSLAFEYQGEQHYRDLPTFSAVSHREAKDIEKSQACQYVPSF
jgi:hypothetical protein